MWAGDRGCVGALEWFPQAASTGAMRARTASVGAMGANFQLAGAEHGRPPLLQGRECRTPDMAAARDSVSGTLDFSSGLSMFPLVLGKSRLARSNSKQSLANSKQSIPTLTGLGQAAVVEQPRTHEVAASWRSSRSVPPQLAGRRWRTPDMTAVQSDTTFDRCRSTSNVGVSISPSMLRAPGEPGAEDNETVSLSPLDLGDRLFAFVEPGTAADAGAATTSEAPAPLGAAGSDSPKLNGLRRSSSTVSLAPIASAAPPNLSVTLAKAKSILSLNDMLMSGTSPEAEPAPPPKVTPPPPHFTTKLSFDSGQEHSSESAFSLTGLGRSKGSMGSFGTDITSEDDAGGSPRSLEIHSPNMTRRTASGHDIAYVSFWEGHGGGHLIRENSYQFATPRKQERALKARNDPSLREPKGLLLSFMQRQRRRATQKSARPSLTTGAFPYNP